MIDAVRVALTALRTGDAPKPGDLPVIRVGDVEGALLGLDDRGRPHLLLPVSASGADLPRSDTATLEIVIRPLLVGGQTSPFLDAACLFESVAEVFDHFIVAVLEQVEAGAEPVEALSLVLEKWRQFLTPPVGPPGRDKLAALFGELLVLQDLVAANAQAGMESWVGPRSGRHDFRLGNAGIEVKTTRAHTARRVTIHGEDQLEEPRGGELHLHLVRVEEVASAGESVSTLVDRLLTAGARADDLFDALTAAGLPVAELAATSDVRFEIRERLTVPVDGDTPRITPGSFLDGVRPVGVLDLTYVIDLDHVLHRGLTQAEYDSMVGRLLAPSC